MQDENKCSQTLIFSRAHAFSETQVFQKPGFLETLLLPKYHEVRKRQWVSHQNGYKSKTAFLTIAPLFDN
jgi:hypothetical protein